MLIQIGNICILNTDHIMKIEKASTDEEKNLILFYHTFNAQIQISKINFIDEKMRDDFFERILTAQENGDKVLRWQM